MFSHYFLITKQLMGSWLWYETSRITSFQSTLKWWWNCLFSDVFILNCDVEMTLPWGWCSKKPGDCCVSRSGVLIHPALVMPAPSWFWSKRVRSESSSPINVQLMEMADEWRHSGFRQSFLWFGHACVSLRDVLILPQKRLYHSLWRLLYQY